MTIESTDKLVVGRGGTSYQVNFQDTGISTEEYVDEVDATNRKHVKDNYMPLNLNTLSPMP